MKDLLIFYKKRKKKLKFDQDYGSSEVAVKNRISNLIKHQEEDHRKIFKRDHHKSISGSIRR